VTAIAPVAIKDEEAWPGQGCSRCTTAVDNPDLPEARYDGTPRSIWWAASAVRVVLSRRLARYVRVEFWSLCNATRVITPPGLPASSADPHHWAQGSSATKMMTARARLVTTKSYHASVSGKGRPNLPGNREGPLGMALSVSDNACRSVADRLAMGTCKGFVCIHNAKPWSRAHCHKEDKNANSFAGRDYEDRLFRLYPIPLTG